MARNFSKLKFFDGAGNFFVSSLLYRSDTLKRRPYFQEGTAWFARPRTSRPRVAEAQRKTRELAPLPYLLHGLLAS